MMNRAELIKAIRGCVASRNGDFCDRCLFCDDGCEAHMMKASANMLEADEKQSKKGRGNEKADTTPPANADPVTWDALCREMAAKDARIVQLERELAAAVEDIEKLLKQDFDEDTCWACAHDFDCGAEHKCKPKWRGLQAENGEAK